MQFTMVACNNQSLL